MLAGGEGREAAPAAADLEHAIAGLEPELVADPLILAPLRVCERLVRPLEDRARVGHRLVEHQREEIVPEVVVVGDVPACTEKAVASVQPRPRFEQPPHARMALRRGRGVS